MRHRCYWKDFGPFVVQFDNSGARVWETLIGIERCRLPEQTGYWLRLWKLGVGFYRSTKGNS
jgi:hypothetical protein